LSSQTEEIRCGKERAIEVAGDRARLLFGLGPAGPEPQRKARIDALRQSLTPAPRAIRWCQQVHGKLLASLSDEPAAPLSGADCVGRCDGLITDESGLGLLVWTADCVPVLMSGGGVVAAVHAGWRGAGAGIVRGCLRRLQVEYGVHASQVRVKLGPSVGACHYQVGTEVIEALRADGGDESSWLDGDRVDLRRFVEHQVTRAGVTQVELIGGCTACDPRLASYRRDGTAAGRQWSLIYRLVEGQGSGRST
jgi:YfiH family protein